MNYQDAKSEMLRMLLPHKMAVYEVATSPHEDFGRHYIVASSSAHGGVTVMIVEYSHGFKDVPLWQWWEWENDGTLVLLSQKEAEGVLAIQGWYLNGGRLVNKLSEQLKDPNKFMKRWRHEEAWDEL